MPSRVALITLPVGVRPDAGDAGGNRLTPESFAPVTIGPGAFGFVDLPRIAGALQAMAPEEGPEALGVP